MQIQAIRNVSFKANEPATEKPAENKDKKQAASLSDFYKKISSNVVYNTRRMSEGREEKDGKLKLAELGTAYASLGVLLLSMVKNIKSLKLKNKAQKLVKENANEEKIKELKTLAGKKFRTGKLTLLAGLLGMMATLGISYYNMLDAKKTAKERGFMTDEEIKLKNLEEQVEKQKQDRKSVV